jgi:protein-S-isoprenylcysteine O-methyltransferase Ste14
VDAKAIYAKAARRVAGFTVATAACLFAPAGTLRWWNAWLFMGVGLVLVSTLTGIVFSKSPELVEERMTAGTKAKEWDKVLFALLAVILPFALNVLAGLDYRFGWTNSLGLGAVLAGLGVMLIGMTLTYWAMRSNRFFSSHVRIQDDRGHVVVSDGPYRYVRHPGYTGAILYNLGAPIVLGSLVALGVGVAIMVVFVMRTVLEDRMLQGELGGYRDYAARVKSRLVPFVW